MNNFPILDKAIAELNKKYGTDFKYKINNGRFWLWDANGVYGSEWYYNNIDYRNEVDPILTKLNEAVVNEFGSDELFVDYQNNTMMYISGLDCEEDTFKVSTYYDDKFKGLEDDVEFLKEEENEFEQYLWEKLSKGSFVNVYSTPEGFEEWLGKYSPEAIDENYEAGSYSDLQQLKIQDDKNEIVTRNEVARTSNRNEVSADNRYTEETRRVLEKLASLAKAVAEKLNWDENLVLQDFIQDLRIINDPSTLAEIDLNNPINQITDQLMRSYIASPEDFNILRNNALAQIMNMREEDAANALYNIFGRAQLGGGATHRLSSGAQRMLGRGRRDSIKDEALIEPTDECLKEVEEIFAKLGFEVEGTGKTWMGRKHYQIRTIENTYDEASLETKFNELENALEELDKKYDCKPTCNMGLMEDGTITAGVDIDKMYIKDSLGSTLEELTSLKKKYDMEGEKKETDEGYFQIVMKDKEDETYFNIMTGIDEEAQIIEQTPHFAMVFWRKYDKGHDPRDFSDSKEDDMRFYEKFGMDNLTRYKRLSQKLEGNNKDITWVIAHIETPEDLNEMMNVAAFGDYTPIAENDKYIVFDVNNLEMAQKLASGANWCITSPAAWNANSRFGARYHFYINKLTGDKYCVAMVGNLKEIVDKNDNELAKLPEGVPSINGEEVVSSVVREDMNSNDALLKTALANVELLPVDTLRIAYDDMFGEELDMLNDDEVKAWLTNKLPEVDTNELKTYIEEHLDDFAVVPEENADYEEEDFDDEYEEDEVDEDEED